MYWLVAVGIGAVVGVVVGWLAGRHYVHQWIEALPLPDEHTYARRRLADKGAPEVDNPCGYGRQVLDYWSCVLAEHGPHIHHRNADGHVFTTAIGDTDPPEPGDHDPYDGDADHDHEPDDADHDHDDAEQGAR